eukprot:2314880-Amphidinium_carterae.3
MYTALAAQGLRATKTCSVQLINYHQHKSETPCIRNWTDRDHHSNPASSRASTAYMSGAWRHPRSSPPVC